MSDNENIENTPADDVEGHRFSGRPQRSTRTTTSRATR